MSNVALPTIIRRADINDIDSMAELLSELFAIEEDFQADVTKQIRGLEHLLQSPGAVIWIAESEGEVAGMLSVQTLISTAEGGPVGLVEDVVVRQDWRGKGLGGKLLRAAEAWAEERGLTRLQLLADRGNASALAFYAKQGWIGTSLVALRKLKA